MMSLPVAGLHPLFPAILGAEIARLQVVYTLLSPFPCPFPISPHGLSDQLEQGSSL